MLVRDIIKETFRRFNQRVTVSDTRVVMAMVRQLRELAPEYAQHETLMQSRFGREYSPMHFAAAVAVAKEKR